MRPYLLIWLPLALGTLAPPVYPRLLWPLQVRHERTSEEVGPRMCENWEQWSRKWGGGSQLRALPPSSFLLLLSLALLGVGTDTQPPLFWSHL